MNTRPSSKDFGSAKFSAVAFDLDGTLYPDSRLFLRLIPFALKNLRLMRAMGKARSSLRKSGAYAGDFYQQQARLMAEILGEDAERVKEKTKRPLFASPISTEKRKVGSLRLAYGKKRQSK